MRLPRRKRVPTRVSTRTALTAISGLSASVSSCGGDGARFGLGGEAFGGGAATFVAFLALWNMGASFLTSSSGAEESPLLSESLIVEERVNVGSRW